MYKKLPPLPQEVFDGSKESVEITFNKCTHSQSKLKIYSGTEVRCECGAGWMGKDVIQLLKTS